MDSALPVARHYDSLDELYRRVWGEHVHHGLWVRGDEAPEEAALLLARRVADAAAIGHGDAVVDVGCGYGATARLLAARYGCEVTGVTVSRRQLEWAQAQPVEGPPPRFLLADWQRAALPDAAFDAVVAIESLSHMRDKRRAVAECARVLRPGGRLVVCDWLSAERPGRLARRALLEPICREARLPSMASATEYAELIRAAGLVVERVEDVSAQVRRTWTVVRRRLLRRLAADADARRLLIGRGNPHRRFALSLARIPLAYRLGAMRLGVMVATRGDRRACAAAAPGMVSGDPTEE